ncbi:MAG: GatB/YqeY domain-containing protein [Candidatus Hydrogenedentota bacterium]
MSLIGRLYEDLKISLKKGEKERLSTIRLLINAIKQEEIVLKREITEDEEINVLNRALKQRNEAISEYKRVNREDLAKKEETEKKIIESYLPSPLSEDEIKECIKAVIKETNAEGIKDFGKVMKGVITRVKGRADGKFVQMLVREMLS